MQRAAESRVARDFGFVLKPESSTSSEHGVMQEKGRAIPLSAGS